MVKTVLCLCLYLTVCQVGGLYLPSGMNGTIKSLMRYYGHYNIPLHMRFNGKPVFPREFPNGNIMLKCLLLGGIMETYEDFITRLMNQLPTLSPNRTDISVPAEVAKSGNDNDIRKQLSNILTNIQDLRKHMFAKQDNILHQVYTIKPIQMDNNVIQFKALWELPIIYETASACVKDPNPVTA